MKKQCFLILISKTSNQKCIKHRAQQVPFTQRMRAIGHSIRGYICFVYTSTHIKFNSDDLFVYLHFFIYIFAVKCAIFI